MNLNKILDSITFEQVKNLTEGETIKLDDNYELYRYLGDAYENEDGELIETEGITVLKLEDEELYCVLLNNLNKTLVFESL